MVSPEWRRQTLSRWWRGWSEPAHNTTRAAGHQKLGRKEPEAYERAASDEKRGTHSHDRHPRLCSPPLRCEFIRGITLKGRRRDECLFHWDVWLPDGFVRSAYDEKKTEDARRGESSQASITHGSLDYGAAAEKE